MIRLFLAGLFASTIALGACDEGIEAPVLSDLQCSPLNIPLGTPTLMSCTFRFSDLDADVSHLSISIESTLPGGNSMLPDAPLPAGFGVGAGTVSVSLISNAATTFQVAFKLVDAAGNVSNIESVSVVAE